MVRAGYLMWFDNSDKVPITEKIEDAVHAFMRRFKEKPNVVLVSETDSAYVPEGKVSMGDQRIVIRPSSYVRKNNFWVGLDLDETELGKQGTEPLWKEAA